MIELSQVSKVYNQGKPNEFTALDGVDLVVQTPAVTVLKGPSGSGKTTLLGVLGCMMRPTSGRVHVEGREVTSLAEPFLAEVRRRTFGFVFQAFNLVSGLDVVTNVTLPAYPLGPDRGALLARAGELLDRFRLGSKARQKIESLSGGEKQRVAIARALVNSPTCIIADEPTAQLDRALAAEFLDMVFALKDEGTSVIVASHDPLVTDSAEVDRVVEILDGRVVSGGAEA